MRAYSIVAAASLCAASAAAHDPHECRTALARFEDRREAFETTAAAIAPFLERLAEAHDQAVEAGHHPALYAAIWRHFVARHPELWPKLSGITGDGQEAMDAAARAIFCLSREEETP